MRSIPWGDVSVDGTPDYMSTPGAEKSARKLFGGAPMRILAILREPASRALSHWRHAVLDAKWQASMNKWNQWSQVTIAGFNSLEEKAGHLVEMVACSDVLQLLTCHRCQAACKTDLQVKPRPQPSSDVRRRRFTRNVLNQSNECRHRNTVIECYTWGCMTCR